MRYVRSNDGVFVKTKRSQQRLEIIHG
jgi:hypothetical protein